MLSLCRHRRLFRKAAGFDSRDPACDPDNEDAAPKERKESLQNRPQAHINLHVPFRMKLDKEGQSSPVKQLTLMGILFAQISFRNST